MEVIAEEHIADTLHAEDYGFVKWRPLQFNMAALNIL